MRDSQPRTIYLKDYREPDFWINKTSLEFDLFADYTEVRSTLEIVRNASANKRASLVLHGQELELREVKIDGVSLNDSEYKTDLETLEVFSVPDRFQFSCVTRIKPHENTSLEGLYKSRTMYCTQCEAEGFRKITYYLDRPDVMSEFFTRISADKASFPVLLSNGNLIDSGETDNRKRHWALWHDPFKKPCYLFALVAGDLVSIDDRFATRSNREVTLRIFVEQKDSDKCDHAMQSLKRAMTWDEEVYGREYDLDIFMIVAVDDFNMGAMENKGLNIFNTSCILAKPETTTDAGFQRVEAVVAHEYFHNWSGNRVTCRDWFQLSLKEGFTVFRDSEFSADMGSRTVKRVEDASMLRTMQFAEDAGPMAHPVQPSSFIEISNFYTLTIYEKGAEIVRMIHTLLGPELFRKGSDLYFERHDGQAVTIEDFVAAMADASGRDFSQFMNWYRQAGTPVLKCQGGYDADKKEFTLKVKQHCPPTPEAKDKKPFHIPLAVGLLGDAGALPLQLKGQQPNLDTGDNTHQVLEVTEAEQEFVFESVEEPPVPSLLRGFSAPVKLDYNYSREELARLMSRDTDGFCRWDASQQLGVDVIRDMMVAMAESPSPSVDARFIDAYRALLEDSSLDPAMVALILQLPSEDYLSELSQPVDVEVIHYARNCVKRKIATALYDNMLNAYNANKIAGEYNVDAASIGKRSLKNTALHYLMITGRPEAIELCHNQYRTAGNMTDVMAALTAITHSASSQVQELKEELLQHFYDKWKEESLVVNQWLSVQASSPVPGTLNTVKALTKHEAFDVKNPNKIRALIGGFCMRNAINFHDRSGEGYAFLADQIIILDRQNPQIASRLLTPLTKWKKYDDNRQALMKKQLQRISEQSSLSKDVYEVVSKSLM